MSSAAPPVNRFFISPTYSVFYRRAKNLVWQEQVRPDYLIVFGLAGKLEYVAATQDGEATAGEILLIEPGQRFSASGKNAEALMIALSPQFLFDYAARMHIVGPGGKVSFSTSRLHKENRLAQLSVSLTAELLSEHAGSEIVIGAVVEQIVVHLLRNFCNMRRSDELELSRVGLIDRRIRRAVELMHSQLDRELSLKEIAGASYLSPFHFARLFKKLTGTSPHAYLATLRCRHAQTLLAESDLSIAEIGTRVGYSSSSHFTQAFRQMTGLTPGGFRKAVVSREQPK